MSKRYYLSDPHIGHELVAWTRGFERTDVPQKWSETIGAMRPVGDSAAHDAVLAENWDRVVGPDDHVIILGDISINPKRDNAFGWIRDRPGTKHLIAGNHDEVHSMHSKSWSALANPLWRDTFITINDFKRLKIEGKTVLLSHFPYDGEGDRDMADRNVEYRLKDMGFPLLHGHTHSKEKHSLSLLGTPQLCLSLDAWDMQLVPESEVIEWSSYLPRPQGT